MSISSDRIYVIGFIIFLVVIDMNWRNDLEGYFIIDFMWWEFKE